MALNAPSSTRCLNRRTNVRPSGFSRRTFEVWEDLGIVTEAIDIHRALLPKFPYGLVSVELAGEVRIVAVAHSKRQPGYWLDRVWA